MINSINSFNAVSYNSQISSVSAEKASSASKGVEINYNPQDELVMDPQIISMPSIHVKKGSLEGNNVKFLKNEKLTPNENGQYSYQKDTRQFISSLTLATVQKTVDEMSAKLGGDIEWAFGGKQIGLAPDAGVDFNAYYSRDDASVNFFHGKDPVTNQKVFSGASGEIVSHEVGHALLDAVRPGYFDTWKADTNGIHEAFADLTGLFMATQNDEVCEIAARETGGDLRKPNCLSDTGELLGRSINNEVGQNVTGGNYIRTFINDFKWQAPHTVDPNPPGIDPLTTEMHSWSRIFTGAQYDLMTAMVDQKVAEGMEMPAAIKEAGNDCMNLLTGAIKMAPQEDASYRDVALLMLKSDADENNGKYHDLILNSFTNRNILFEGDDTPSGMRMNAAPRKMTITLDGSEYGMFSGAEVTGTVSGGIGIMSGSGSDELAQDIKMLIQNGSILYTEPNQKVEKKDLFDKNGNPYVGVVRWTDGKMVIERNKMIG